MFIGRSEEWSDLLREFVWLSKDVAMDMLHASVLVIRMYVPKIFWHGKHGIQQNHLYYIHLFLRQNFDDSREEGLLSYVKVSIAKEYRMKLSSRHSIKQRQT